jgi:hypothetical protein
MTQSGHLRSPRSRTHSYVRVETASTYWTRRTNLPWILQLYRGAIVGACFTSRGGPYFGPTLSSIS